MAMSIGFSSVILLIGALIATLILLMFIIVGMMWLNSRLERLRRDHIAAVEMLNSRLEDQGR